MILTHFALFGFVSGLGSVLPTTGLTLHLDAKATTHLYTSLVSGSGTPADGDQVQAWDDEGDGISDVLVTYPSSAVQSPNFRSVTPLMRHSCLDFDGSTDNFQTKNQTASSTKALSSFISASAATLIVAFYPEAITNTNATASNNELIVGNSSFGLYTRDVSGVKKLRGLNYDGTEDSLEVTITTGASFIGILRHESGLVKLSVIDSTGTETAASDVASGNTAILTAALSFGQNISRYNGRIGEVAVWNVALSGSDLTDAKAYFVEQWLGLISVAPSVGAVTTGGLAPTLVIGGDFTMTPAVGAIAAAGVAPTAVVAVAAAPGVGSIVATGQIPSAAVVTPSVMQPAVGAIAVAGLAPSLVTAMRLSPAVGAIVAAGLVPDLRGPVLKVPGAGAMAVTGLTPLRVVSDDLVAFALMPGAGQIGLSGGTPTLRLFEVIAQPPLDPTASSTGYPIFQSADENILRQATWSGTAPDGSYDLATLRQLDPSARIRFVGGSATVTASIPSSRGDVLVIPVTNATSLQVTNGSGLNVSIAIPAMPRNRIPRTIVADLTLAEPSDTVRTSALWHFAFTGTGDLVIGAVIALYAPRRELQSGDFQWGGGSTQIAYGTVKENEYGTRYRLSNDTQRRSVTLTKLALPADRAAMEAWFDRSGGSYGPSLLWPDPDVNDAYFGTLPQELEVKRVAPTAGGHLFSIAFQFDELNKGRPV